MTVYVDDMYLYPMGQFRRMKMSHMIADTKNELHAMAKKLGLRHSWYQGDHYDVSMTKREEAIRFGAVPVTLKQLTMMNALRRAGQSMGAPETAGTRFRELVRERNKARFGGRVKSS